MRLLLDGEDAVDLATKTYYTRAMSDADLQVLESQLPAVSGQAFDAAREQVLDSGESVLQSEGGFVVRVYPDGRKEVVKQIEPPIRVKSGTLHTLS